MCEQIKNIIECILIKLVNIHKVIIKLPTYLYLLDV